MNSLPSGITRKKIVDALLAEGVTGLSEGYSNLHKLKLFKKNCIWKKWISLENRK